MRIKLTSNTLLLFYVLFLDQIFGGRVSNLKSSRHFMTLSPCEVNAGHFKV
jgi:hypothetical protein